MPLNPILATVLAPFAVLYGLVTDVWHGLYDLAWRKGTTFNRFVIGVGNLVVGGTGKTPHVEYLVRLLRSNVAVATLSRGYGRQTQGYRLVGPTDTAATVGDEPLQFYQKFGENIAVAVGEERALAIPYLLRDRPQTQVIVLDDAFQHRAVQPALNLLLTDYNSLFFNDYPLPSGRLRERRHGAQRADAVLVTKCPATLSEVQKHTIQAQIRRYSRENSAIFFTKFFSGNPVALATQLTVGPERKPVLTKESRAEVLLVTGLANPDPLEAHVRETYGLAQHLRFADHHEYSFRDLEKIGRALNALPGREKVVLTSEKDAVKLRVLLVAHPEMLRWPILYVPIEVEFLFGEGPMFDAWVLEEIRRFAVLSGPSRNFSA
ncbi:MAG: tetraacyldisaccharide 4'-kinase [Cytophagaceae bacterium]|nr:tetraacyldisaccharide 4'-kinase [Cytophagaceae bacterium]